MAVSSGMDSTNLVPSNLIKSIPYSGYSMEFDPGDSDYVDVGDFQPSTTKLSISAWAYKTDTSQASIIGRGASVDYGIFVYGSSLQFGLNTGSWTTITTTIPTVNTWFHVCATWDGTTMKLYVDGVLASSASKTGTISYTSNNTTIGKNSTLSGFEWDGKISNVAIWDKAITEDEILRVYNGGSPGDLSNLGSTGWWSLGADSYFDGTNWICPDLSTNSNNGTSANMGAANLVGDGPDSLANGTSTNLDLASDLIGEAPGSTGNAISINMNSLARTGSTP